jgi:hypothetical protein
VARYYYRRGAYLAAANRAMGIMNDFRDSPSIEEALFIMIRSYDKLGMTELRDDTERVFKLNYPNSKFLDEGKKPNASGGTSGAATLQCKSGVIRAINTGSAVVRFGSFVSSLQLAAEHPGFIVGGIRHEGIAVDVELLQLLADR